MLVRRRGPRRIPGPRRPHPCGKDIMTFSLADFMGYCMSVISAIEDSCKGSFVTNDGEVPDIPSDYSK